MALAATVWMFNPPSISLACLLMVITGKTGESLLSGLTVQVRLSGLFLKQPYRKTTKGPL